LKGFLEHGKGDMDGYGTSSSANMVTGLDREALWGLMTQTSGTGERRLAGGWDQSQRAYLVSPSLFLFFEDSCFAAEVPPTAVASSPYVS